MSTATRLDVEPGPRWPLQPLLDACQLTRGHLAFHLHVSGTTLTSAAREGLTDADADRWATRLGFHPVAVWGWDWVTAGLDAGPATVLGRLIDQLRERITSGELRPGDWLPHARALGEVWGVSRNTAALVVAALCREGRLTATGSGPRRRIVVTEPGHVCAECGQPIEPDTEHYPHEPDCPGPDVGGCDCHRPTHPDCCPTCTGGGR